MRKLMGVFCLMCVLCSCSAAKLDDKQPDVIEFVELQKLPTLNYDSMDQLLMDKKTAVVYFGWIVNCGDSINFQTNYFEAFLKENADQLKDKLFVFNLDEVAPEALKNKELRAPLTEKYNVMYSPTLIFVKDGVIVDKVEWTLKTSNPHTAIPKESLDVFFENTGLVK